MKNWWQFVYFWFTSHKSHKQIGALETLFFTVPYHLHTVLSGDKHASYWHSCLNLSSLQYVFNFHFGIEKQRDSGQAFRQLDHYFHYFPPIIQTARTRSVEVYRGGSYRDIQGRVAVIVMWWQDTMNLVPATYTAVPCQARREVRSSNYFQPSPTASI